MDRSLRLIRRAGVALLLIAAAAGLHAVTGVRNAAASVPLHLSLLRSSPAADTTLTASPTDIRLWFSEAPEMAATTIRLTAGSGTVVPLAKPQRDEAEDAPVVAVIQSPLAPGAYEVAWRAMSRDGHVVKGQFAFTVSAMDTGRTP